jgi:hypothetical protein
MRGCRQRFAFARVLPLPAHRTFFFVVHRKPFRKIVFRAPGNIADSDSPHTRRAVSTPRTINNATAAEFELAFVAAAFLS